MAIRASSSQAKATNSHYMKRQLYALTELAKASLTHLGLLQGYPGYVVDAEDYHLFIGALDDLADLGVAAYASHGSTIPVTVFNDYYDGQQPTMMRVRSWLSAASMRDQKAAAILARLACLEAVLNAMLTPPQDESEYFASDGSLRRRLASIFLPGEVDYSFPQSLPQRLDQLYSSVLRP
jgi:hypothetical protein